MHLSYYLLNQILITYKGTIPRCMYVAYRSFHHDIPPQRHGTLGLGADACISTLRFSKIWWCSTVPSLAFLFRVPSASGGVSVNYKTCGLYGAANASISTMLWRDAELSFTDRPLYSSAARVKRPNFQSRDVCVCCSLGTTSSLFIVVYVCGVSADLELFTRVAHIRRITRSCLYQARVYIP